MIIRVKGGTDAGKKRLFFHPPWLCMCLRTELGVNIATVRKENPGYRYSCPDCGARRPK